MTNRDKEVYGQKSLINWEFMPQFVIIFRSIFKRILTFFVNMFEYRCGNRIEA